MTPEAQCKKAIKALLHKYNIYYFMPVTNIHGGRVGIGDFCCCVGGFFVSIESKSEDGKASKIQVIEADKVNASGGLAIFVKPSQLDQLEKVLLKILDKMRKFQSWVDEPKEPETMQ